jgi:hypothetical protein
MREKKNIPCVAAVLEQNETAHTKETTHDIQESYDASFRRQRDCTPVRFGPM